MGHLKRPWHKSYIKHHQDNALHQYQFMQAQNTLQNTINAMRQAALAPNPYI